MSDIIRLLPDHITNQIKAGEVVQRPASVVKELVENSIDAGATRIEVNIKDAGRTLIQIIDNGKGMSTMDARMCFERHATSKIAHTNDLYTLQTKGFRGEALASISAVAHVSLKTRQESDELGTYIQINGSELQTQEPIVCPIGTNFEIKNLFYNVPVRRNFLKSDTSEFKQIEDEFHRIALAHPNLFFKLSHNDSVKYHLDPSNLRMRIKSIFGDKIYDKLVPINESTDIVKIEGFVGKPEIARKTRGEQFFFVNNRFFKDSFFNHAVTKAFEQLIDGKLHPSYFLFLEIDPKFIDVNVHPMKTEVKFQEDKAIYSILRTAVRSGLGKFNITPVLDFDQEVAFELPYEMRNSIPKEPTIQVDPTFNPFQVKDSTTNFSSGGSTSFGKSSGTKNFSTAINKSAFGSSDLGNWEEFWKDEKPEIQEEVQKEEQLQIDIEFPKPVGPFLTKGSFILSSVSEGLLVIHHRRANECLIYKEMMERFMLQPLGAQQLLFPMEKLFSKSEKNTWEEHRKTLERLGFMWEWNSETLLLNGIPDCLTESTVLACIDKIVELLEHSEIDKSEMAHIVVTQLAFAGSIHAKLNTDQHSIEEFVNRLTEIENFHISPNGKRVVALIPNESFFQLF